MLTTILPAATPAQLASSLLFARIMRNARAAAIANPRNAGLAPNPPTITDCGPTLPPQVSRPYFFLPGAPGVWSLSGGTALAVGGNLRVYAAVIGPSGGNLGGNDGKQASFWRVGAIAQSRYVAFRVGPTSAAYRILVDGRYVSRAGTVPATTSGATPQYLLMDFGSRGVRRIALEGQQTGSFVGAYVEGSGAIAPIDDSEIIHATMLGDSYVEGAGPAARGDGVAAVLEDWLGVAIHASGSGGTGWSRSAKNAYRFDERIANGDLALGGAAPDILFLTASINDRGADAAAVTANALSGLRAARAQYPLAPIIVYGCPAGATGPSTGAPSVVSAEQSVRAAVEAFADPLTVFAPISTDPNGAWVDGTGTVAAATGSGNSDWATSSDGIHPSEEGAAMLGRRYADAAIRAMSRLYGV